MNIFPTAFAQTIHPPITTAQGLLKFMCTIFAWMFYGLIVLSVIMATVAAFNYVTSNGDGEKVGRATKTILYAAIAVAVALLARGIPPIVATFMGASGAGLTAC